MMRRSRLLRALVALALPLSGTGSSYSLLEMTCANALINASAFGLEGLHIGSGMAFQPTCINIDIDGITDSEGVRRASAATPDTSYAAAAAAATSHDHRHHRSPPPSPPPPRKHNRHHYHHLKPCFQVATELGGGLYAMIPENESEMSPLLHFLQYDCTGRLPFADQSVKWIFTEHFIGELR